MATRLLFLIIFSSVFLSFNIENREKDIFNDVEIAIKTGNSGTVARFFDDRVELRIFDKGGVYSKKQATLILGDFFKSHKPKNFKIKHKGRSPKGILYAVGQMSYNGGVIRTSIFFVEKNKKKHIQSLTFE